MQGAACLSERMLSWSLQPMPCLQNAPTCYFTEAQLAEQGLQEAGASESRVHSPASSLYALEGIIAQRRQAAADSPAGEGT